jgi:hypothetical protein
VNRSGNRNANRNGGKVNKQNTTPDTLIISTRIAGAEAIAYWEALPHGTKGALLSSFLTGMAKIKKQLKLTSAQTMGKFIAGEIDIATLMTEQE